MDPREGLEPFELVHRHLIALRFALFATIWRLGRGWGRWTKDGGFGLFFVAAAELAPDVMDETVGLVNVVALV